MVMMKLGRVLRKVFSSNEGRTGQQANVMVKTFSSGFSGAKVNLLGRTGHQANVMVKTSSTVMQIRGFGSKDDSPPLPRTWYNDNEDKLRRLFTLAYEDYPVEDTLLEGLKFIKKKFNIIGEITVGQDQNRNPCAELIHTVKTPIDEVDKQGNQVTRDCTYILKNVIREHKKATNLTFTVDLGGNTFTVCHVKILRA